MGLEDIAKMITQYKSTQRAIVTVMRSIGTDKPTLSTLITRTRFKERYLRYIITMLRRYGIVKGEKHEDGYKYYLSPDAFAEHIKVKFVQALQNVARGRGG